MSQYEIRRLRKIHRNEARLKSLGLGNHHIKATLKRRGLGNDGDEEGKHSSKKKVRKTSMRVKHVDGLSPPPLARRGKDKKDDDNDVEDITSDDGDDKDDEEYNVDDDGDNTDEEYNDFDYGGGDDNDVKDGRIHRNKARLNSLGLGNHRNKARLKRRRGLGNNGEEKGKHSLKKKVRKTSMRVKPGDGLYYPPNDEAFDVDVFLD
jgi:hypothetical protein